MLAGKNSRNGGRNKSDKNKYLRQLPKVDEVLDWPEVRVILDIYPRQAVVDGIREVIEGRRSDILGTTGSLAAGDIGETQYNSGTSISDTVLAKLSQDSIVNDIDSLLKKQFEPSMRRLINATGVVIHTNLGRSILSESAIDAVVKTATGYSNLEFDLEKGERGSRHSHVEGILTRITGAEAAMVVNNNASAVLIALSTLAHGREAIVSRGQLVEIGGSFRIPDVMRQSGAKLVEVGTTNKTYVDDYRVAVTDDTGLLMKVHPSNFRILGFTHEVSLEEIVMLGDELGIPVIEDLGSGVLIDLSRYGIEHEPTVQESVRAGVDVVTFSGDKLLGGPQAGLIVGRAEYIARMKKHPLARALRIDKMTLAALEATLREYLDMDAVCKKNPTLRMITMGEDELLAKAKAIASLLIGSIGDGFIVSTEKDVSRVGGGSLPLAELPTTVVTIKARGAGKKDEINMPCNTGFAAVNDIQFALRRHDPPVIARIKEDAILLDPRTVQDGEENDILSAFMALKKLRESLESGDVL
jgi:L-seryl-tRNA(Ser) seleniumtransferase